MAFYFYDEWTLLSVFRFLYLEMCAIGLFRHIHDNIFIHINRLPVLVNVYLNKGMPDEIL